MSSEENSRVQKNKDLYKDDDANKKETNKKIKLKHFLIFLFLVLVAIISIFFITQNIKPKEQNVKNLTAYLSSETKSIELYDNNYNQVSDGIRGNEINIIKKDIINNDNVYYEIEYNNEIYYVLKDNISYSSEDVVKESKMYVRTPVTVYKDKTGLDILSLVKKGEEVEILGIDYINDDGSVNRYHIRYNDVEGYVYGKYLVNTYESASENYNENGIYDYHSQYKNTLGGGSAANLDFYPYEKASFSDNVMPEEVRALYINGAAIKNVDSYIELAQQSNINAFVVDIKDNTSPAYESKVYEKYSPTNYKYAINTFDDYQQYIKKLKDAGFYVIGRITVFKDSYYIADHPEDAIMDVSTNTPFSHNGSYWPSAFRRNVWQFNVELAVEAVTEMGFNEIQFDYVRFPDRTKSLEDSGTINMNNPYNEEKAQAIQEFIMYATDELHNVNAYVSVDVFGESAHDYVTAYGQYWPAISNIVDVISGMPYPDHFNAHNYGIEEVVWTVPYKLLSAWSSYVVRKQASIATPAIVRTWIQAYDSSKTPATVYDANMVSLEIQALYDNGLTGGFITWNSGSSLTKYEQLKSAFKKEYKHE